MAAGSAYGGKGWSRAGIGLFVRSDGGYTSVTVVCALLVSACLVVASAATHWVRAKASEVQQVADASAMAGANSVAAYTTIAQVVDASVLSLGLTGVIVCGAGLVVTAIPGAAPAGTKVFDAGTRVLDARRKFSKSANEGMEHLEGALPLIIVANSAAVVGANSDGGTTYHGCAVPFPVESQSKLDFGDEVNEDQMADAAERMAEASERAADARRRADEAHQEGWRHDCGDAPYNMHQRAGSLSGVAPGDNPYYPSSQGWNFGVALKRCRAYYAARAASEVPDNASPEAQTDSACRKRFYEYAAARMNAGHYYELPDGSVDFELPELPRNTNEMRETTLYTQSVWPCTREGDKRVIHGYAGCPGAKGAAAGTASVSAVDTGGAQTCPVCHLTPATQGQVANASTNIENGYEHHWRALCEEAELFRVAREELAEANREMEEISEESKDAFRLALEAISVKRPSLCPPGAWGCVSVVEAGEGETIPSELTRAFCGSATLPARAAISAATLAPDDATQDNNILSRFFEGLGAQDDPIAGVPVSICTLWGRALLAYGSAYDSVSSATNDMLGGLDSLGLGPVADALRAGINDIVGGLGFEPADMRMRKPVLTNSQNVLDKVGMESVAEARTLIERLPRTDDPMALAQAVGAHVADSALTGKVTIAELPIPGTELSIPLTIDLDKLKGSS